MGLARTLLRPVAYLGGMHAARQRSAFLAAHKDTRGVQGRLLMELVGRHADSDFGRKHGFAKIASYEDFKAAVPIGDYENFRPYVDQVLSGNTAALLPPGEEVVMFSMTSGTTGKPKHIPVTGRFLAAMRRGWNIFGVGVLQDHPAGWLRQVLQISSSMRESTSVSGKPCGAISGMLAATQQWIVRRMYVVPPGVSDIADAAAKYYTILRCAIGRDVALITTANPSSTIKLIENGQEHFERLVKDVADGTLTPPESGMGDSPMGSTSMQGRDAHATMERQLESLRFRPNPALARRLEEGHRRDGQLLPRHFWDLAFLTNWTGGTLKLYLRRLGELFPAVPVRDIGLLASEGRFSVPIADGTAAGVAEITANFLEFIPADERENPNAQALCAHELTEGQEYFLVFSNWTGLFRYNLDDRIRVVGKYGQSPVFEFLCRGLHTANITGEKITEHQVVEAMRRSVGAAASNGQASLAEASLERFCLQGRFAAVPYYELRVELPAAAAAAVARRFDESLCELNVEYRSKRHGGRLGPVRPVLLAPGTFEQAEIEQIRLRRGRREQYKHKYLLTDVKTDGV